MESKEYVGAKEVYIKTDRIQGNMVLLKENDSDPHYFMMFVGDAEITAIAKEKGLVEPKRPLTHDLYLTILDKAGVAFDRIEIYEMQENTYYANVIATIGDQEVVFDSRPSDAWRWLSTKKRPYSLTGSCFAANTARRKSRNTK